MQGHQVKLDVEAKSEKALKDFDELLEAGFRTRSHLVTWGMEMNQWWQLKMFPSDSANLETGLLKLIGQKLGDDAESWANSLEWEITTVFDHLWKALHRIALEAQNVNHRRSAARTLGKAYAEARQNEQGSKPHAVTRMQEFKRVSHPFRDSRRPPDPKLVHWVSSRMNFQRELWERALDVLLRTKTREPWIKKTRNEDGTFNREWQRMETVDDAWEKFFNDDDFHPTSSLADEFRDHPFYVKKLSYDEMSSFPTLWDKCLAPVLREEWERDITTDRLRHIGEKRFTAKFGDSKRPMTGYRLAHNEWEYAWKETPQRMLKNHIDVREKIIKAFHTRHPGAGEKLTKSPLSSTCAAL